MINSFQDDQAQARAAARLEYRLQLAYRTYQHERVLQHVPTNHHRHSPVGYRRLRINQSEYQSMNTIKPTDADAVKTYGVVTHSGSHVDTGGTLRGAKATATRNGFTAVSLRSPLGYNIEIVARKVNGKWVAS